ncbi:MAG: hypothetical protein QF903_02470 [Planctomycetota bacterium]|jgi:hypothetical protein|nr:hypothetical protein [Planctomycetota bacterium]MDP6762788.1 hypothetical protein [Planctomycetota bacterium]MDP6988325.1 hypothetical protein [Planctomycetota bacterium]
MRAFLLLGFVLWAHAAAVGQNSMRKIRPAPSTAAARAGSAIGWRDDLSRALEGADKPVFWYVPTIHRSPMDRKTEIDRYLAAGPFSWPRTIALLEEHFVPVRMIPDKVTCARYALAPLEFVEPGWIVLSPDGEELAREHQITTFHPARFLAPLAALVGEENPAIDGLPGSPEDPATAIWLTGVAHWLAGEDAEARGAWRRLTEEHPEHPLAWKAAMELEGHGPLVHAFETYADLPAAALVPSADGTTAVAGTWSEDELWERGTAFLLATQRANGGWEDSTYDFGGTDSLPNVFVSISSICTIALLERAARLEETDSSLEDGLARALAYATDEANLNRADTDEIVWVHVFRVRALSRWLELRPDGEREVAPNLRRALDDLLASQGRGGAWAHEYANPFVTADALIAMSKAKSLMGSSESVEATVERGIASLLRCRTAEGAYTYGTPRRGRARASLAGSVGRTPRGELALALWSPDDSIGLAKAVALSFENERYLLPARKYDDHTSSYGYGGFFFWYDLHARAEAIAALPDAAAAEAARLRAREQILGLPEFDGAFVDSHETGRSYATAMALWSLALLAEGSAPASEGPSRRDQR